MPFALLIIGVWLLVAGVRDTAGPVNKPGTLFYLIKGDFTGPDNFVYWFLAIILIGTIGYVPKLKPVSTAFLTLVIIVLFLKRGSSTGVGGGFFSQFISGVGITQNSGNTRISDLQTQLDANQVALQTVNGQISQSINDRIQQTEDRLNGITR